MATSANNIKPNRISIEFGEATFTWENNRFSKAFITKDSSVTYEIGGESVQEAELISDQELIVIKTKSSLYFKHKNNKKITGNNDWIDYFYEPVSSSFYRKDNRNFWYDTEGAKLISTVILKEDTLISLKSKVSKRNQIFKNQTPYTSPNTELIQIGKIVFDSDLRPVTYYKQKITGLGKNVITFDDGTVYQEVLIGIDKTCFINEKDKQPVIVTNFEITLYKEKIDLGNFSFYIFSDGSKEFYLNIENAVALEIQDSTYSIDPRSYIRIGGEDVVKIKSRSNVYFYNLTKNEAFQLPDLGKSDIIKIERSYVAFNNCELYNITTKKKSIVVRSGNKRQYLLESAEPHIEKIKIVPGFENIFAFVTIEGKQQLFSLQSKEVILLENDVIVAVEGHSKSKLLNAITANGQRTALDLRKGYKNLTMAKAESNFITQTESEPFAVGSKILQNVKVQTLDGVRERVIDLNTEGLDIFKLPENMMTYTDGEEKSVFAGTEIIRIDYQNVINIGDEKFLSAFFRSYDDELHTVIIDQKSGKPIRMDGLGHKLEMVTSFITNKKGKTYQIGQHEMVNVNTLREDLKKDELLFSINIMSSWIPFSDGYLPILKQIVEGTEPSPWNYHLYELRTLSNEKEFIAVEQIYPHRILVKNKGDRQEPLVVKSKEKVLKSPDEISIISKLFYNDTGVLVEVY